MDYLMLLAGLAIIITGANALVSGASSLAKKYGISDMVIGLTIVGFGTSAPELIINTLAAVKGSTGIAIGNVLGSNIANIFLILGIAALIYPLKVADSARKRDIPISFVAVLVLALLVNDILIGTGTANRIVRADGIILLICMAAYLFYTFKTAKKDEFAAEEKQIIQPLWKSALYIAIGLAGLFFGGQFFVDGAISIARELGMSERVIGLTIVAIGTSLPELATSVVAAFKKKADIAVGNVVGSNIFNIFFILGTTSVISPLAFETQANVDVILTILASTMLFLTSFTFGKKTVDRIEGAIFLVIYIAYIIYLL
jgi:cation:H+ antiporter